MDTPIPAETPASVLQAFFVASAMEAVILLMIMAYSPLYLHQHFHASYLEASMGAALPALMTFAGSMLWSQLSRRFSLVTLGVIGLAGYLGLGSGAILSNSAWSYIAFTASATIFSSALAPATLASLTVGGGNMGGRLATRLRWQSAGWMVSGLFGGWLFDLTPRSFPWLLFALGVAACVPLALLWRQGHHVVPVVAVPSASQVSGTGPARGPLLVVVSAVVLPFFLAYAGNEGFFTNFGIYLHATGVSSEWVGWSSAISTAGGWLLASRIGRWSDHYGGRTILIGVFSLYGLVYLVMALIHLPLVSIVAFSLPLYPLLNIGVQRAGVEDIPSHLHGSIMGWINGASGLATFAGTTLLGALEDHQGPQAAPWGAFALVACALILSLSVRPRNPSRPHAGLR